MHTATQLATKMKMLPDRMKSATSRSINKATRTTLSANFKAQEANQQNLQITKQFCTAFQQTIDNIHSRKMNLRKWIQDFKRLFNNVTTYVKGKGRGKR